MSFNSTTGGLVSSNTNLADKWDAFDLPASDLYSNWVRTDSKDGYVSFHYFLENEDWVGVIRVQAHNSPDNTSLAAVNVELSDGTTGVNVTTGTNASGFIHVTKNKANYFRMFLDHTSSNASSNNYITCAVYQ